MASYMSEDKKDLGKVIEKMNGDADSRGSVSRFGFFSIPYSSYIGDRYYSQGRMKTYKMEGNKVRTSPRGIFTNPIRKGKVPEAYFSNAVKEENEILEKNKEQEEKERNQYLQKVRSRKKGAGGDVVNQFRPGGPQEYKDFYDIHRVEYKIPITKELDKTQKINKEKRSVFIENRGIYTNPAKEGTSLTPGILFSSYKDDQLAEKVTELKTKQDGFKNERKTDKKETKKQMYQFKPASVAKNEPFQKDNELYGEDDDKVKRLLEQTKQVKKE